MKVHPANRARLLKIFAAAVVIRWSYALLLYAIMGNSGFLGVDSVGYLESAQSFAAAIANSSVSGWEWLGPHPYTMPLAMYLFTIHALLFGSAAPFAYALTQGLVDAGTCVVVYFIACSVNGRYALPAAVFAILNPTQIVLSAFFYTDTTFAFFLALSLYATVRWMAAPAWRWSILIGFAIGLAALIRVLAVLWIPFLGVFLLSVCLLRKKLSIRHVAQASVAGLIVALCLAPVLWRNISQYDTWALTPQTGLHFAGWVVPLIQEAKDGTPWSQSYERMERLTQERFKTAAVTPFEKSRRYKQIGSESFSKFTAADVMKAWVLGGLINLGAPAIILSPPISQLPRTGFFSTTADSSAEKITQFIFRSDNNSYALILLIGIAGVAATRLVQLVGLASTLKRGEFPILALFILWIAFVLGINGPVASPKYRLPIEPALAFLSGAGWCALRDRLARANHTQVTTRA